MPLTERSLRDSLGSLHTTVIFIKQRDNLVLDKFRLASDSFRLTVHSSFMRSLRDKLGSFTTDNLIADIAGCLVLVIIVRDSLSCSVLDITCLIMKLTSDTT